MEYLLNIITAGTETFCIIFLLSSFFKPQGGLFKTSVIYLICFTLYCWVPIYSFLSVSIILKLASSVLIWFFCACFAFKGGILQKLFIVFCFFIALCALDLIVFQILLLFFEVEASQILKEQGYYILGAFCTRSILILITVSICRIKNFRTFISIAYSTWLILLLFPMFSIFAFSINLEKAILQNNISFPILFEVAALLALNISLVFLLNKLEQADIIKQEKASLELDISQNMKTIHGLQAIYNEQRSLTHDFNHHIDTIHGLLTNKNNEAALLYTKSLVDNPSTGMMVVSTNNQILDVLLNQKYALAKSQNTDVRFTVNDLSALPLPDKDIVVIVGNLLDNALQACAMFQAHSCIQFKMLKQNEQTLLSVGNTALPSKCEDNKFVTNKSNAQAHGFGLQNIKKTLRFYNCEYSIQCKNEWFEFTAILQK